MKLLSTASLLFAVVLLLGCASSDHGLALAPVGPPTSSSADHATGSLVVFSAFDPEAHFNSLPYRRFYSDYRIYSEDGKLVQAVHNDNGTSLEGPRRVSLPVGSYRVVARANGYGEVTVPTIIAANQTTTMHLEGGSTWQHNPAFAHADPVRLPDGQIVGWRAQANEAPPTSSP